MANKYNFFTICKLLLKHDLWKKDDNSIFDDKLITKDGSVRFYSNTPVIFRNNETGEELYRASFFAWLIILILSWRLSSKIKGNIK